MVSVNHLLIAINSAFNFLFYLSYCVGKKQFGELCQSDNAVLPLFWVETQPR